ncbi:hypothetical protein ACFX1T_005654 [Malus domestica]
MMEKTVKAEASNTAPTPFPVLRAYCKKGCFADGLRLFEGMERENLSPTLETVTTLIHGAGVVRNPIKARQLFDEIRLRNLLPDTGAYNL